MAIEFLGYETRANAQNLSTTLNVPDEADYVIATSNSYPGINLSDVELNDSAMTLVFRESYLNSTIYGIANPATGSAVPFTATADQSVSEGICWIFAYFSGVDQSTPIRDADGGGGASGGTVRTIDCAVDDYLFVSAGGDANPSWVSNVTELANYNALSQIIAIAGDLVESGTTIETGTTNGNYSTMICCTIIPAGGETGITGTAAITQEPQEVAASGGIAFSGTATVTQEAQNVSASGGISFSGTVAITQESQSIEAAGGLSFSGSATITQEPQSIQAAGGISFTGSAAITQEAQTVSAAGEIEIVGFYGSATIEQEPQTVQAAGGISFSGSATITQEPQAVSASGLLLLAITGTAQITQEPQRVFSRGSVNGSDFYDIPGNFGYTGSGPNFEYSGSGTDILFSVSRLNDD